MIIRFVILISLLSSLFSRPRDLYQGLIAYYPLDGHVFDLGDQGIDGVNFGAIPGMDSSLNFDGSMSFDGINDYIEIPHHPSLHPTEELTISVWAYSNQWSEVSQPIKIVSKTQEGGYSIGINGPVAGAMAHLFFTVKSNGTYLTAKWHQDNINPGWHHIAGVFNGIESRLYVDGVLVDANQQSDYGSLQYSFNNSLLLGAEASQGELPSEGFVYWNGMIDEVRLYDRALSTEDLSELQQIQSHFLAGDVNNDDVIDILDIIIIVDHLFGDEFSGYQAWAGDLNEDGEINVFDIIMIINLIIAESDK